MKVEAIDLYGDARGILLTVYLHDLYEGLPGNAGRPTVVICPGGGYVSINEKETGPVALRFLADGYNVFVLSYSIGMGAALFPNPFVDLAYAVAWVRKNARGLNCDSGRIAVCGFSTGGHVAAVLGTGWRDAYLQDTLRMEPEHYKPDAMILCYPLLNLESFKAGSINGKPERKFFCDMLLSAAFGTATPANDVLENWNCTHKVSEHTVPTFLWSALEDAVVGTEDAMKFAAAMAHHKRQIEFHLFQKGVHGMALGNKLSGYEETERAGFGNSPKWIDLALDWLDQVMGKQS